MSPFLLPPSARIWLFLADRELSAEAHAELSHELDQFTQSWQAHGEPLTAESRIFWGRLVLIAVDESQTPPSGCSIDKAFRLLTAFSQKHGIDFFKRTLLGIPTSESSLETLAASEVLEAYQAGVFSAETTVVNAFAQNLGDFLNQPLLPLKETWLANKLTQGTGS